MDQRTGQGNGQHPDAPRVPGLVLERVIGRGGQGEVWQACDLGTDQPVAVKLTRRGEPRDGPDEVASAQRLATEIAVLTRIRHPHLVRLRRVVDLPDSRALVLDLAAGGSLAAMVQARGRLDPAEVSTVLVGIARALAYLHDRGLVHGDLTPGNVLFTGAGRPLLSDFGTASVLGQSDRAGWETPGFADPSAARSGDPARDIWSLGAVARYALCGGADEVTEPPPTTALDAVIEACLEPDPSARPSAVSVAQTVWRAVPPAPIRLLGEMRAEAALALEVTRRVRELAVGQGPAKARPGGQATDRVVRLRQLASSAVRQPAGEPRRWRPRRPDRPVAALMVGLAGLLAALLGVAFGAGLVPDLGRSPLQARGSPGIATAPTGISPVPARTEASRLPGPSRSACTAATGTPARVARTVCVLAAARARALESLSETDLAAVDAPGSAALAADLALLRRLRAQGVHLDGLAFSVRAVRLLSASESEMAVSAEVTTSAHRQQRADGSIAVPVPAGAVRSVRLDLVAGGGPGGWRVSSVG